MSFIITDAELASYLGVEVTPQVTSFATLAGDLVEEAWAEPVSPAPVWVRTLALTVAARAIANPKGLTSWTRSFDDVSRTERMEGGSEQFGLYLTDAERAQLAGVSTGVSSAGTIHTAFRGERC